MRPTGQYDLFQDIRHAESRVNLHPGVASQLGLWH